MPESNGAPGVVPETKPNPDPTTQTIDAIMRATKAEREFTQGQVAIITARLDAMDRATSVLSDNMNRVPTALQTAIKSFSGLMDEKFIAIDNTFKAAENLRLEQKQDSKIGLDAALAAQKDSAVTQDINNQKAIDKSDKNTAELIKGNQEANKQALDTLTKGLDELKLDVSKMLAAKQGGAENRSEQRLNWGMVVGTIGGLVGLASFIYAVSR